MSASPLGIAAPNPRNSKTGVLIGLAIAAGVAVVVLLVVILVIVLKHETGSNGLPTNANPNEVIPGSSGMTLSELTSNVRTQITGSGSSNFNVSGVSSVICNPPPVWKDAATFTCYAYAHNSQEIGQYDGIVTPDASSGGPQWNGQWAPSLAYGNSTPSS